MPALDPSLRDLLATVIGKDNADGGARVVAEAGARAAIEALAVHLAASHAHLDAAGKQLRVRLRARARQLGDTRHDSGRYEIGRLVEQAAYEHWHRMLFARFLAENNLLIHPDMNVAVTLEECAELAASEGAMDGWELAGRYASRMLPQLFRPDDPLLAVRFAIDDVRKLENLLDSLPAELFRASDSLGWCYQFWQARRKKEINVSEVRIGAEELPAVTQLFTEPYMVQFLLHNTLGAWWVGAGRTLPSEMAYLRRLDDGRPAAGSFEGWPRQARELKILDPCCGSGHFLVGAFEILATFRMAEEGLSAREACDAVLRDNLFGLELDARCVQIAAFALAMAAWTFPNSGGYRLLAAMNVACSGWAISAKKDEWERLGGENVRLRSGMGRMWDLFNDAPMLGSLIDPTREPADPMFTAGFAETCHLLSQALSAEQNTEDTERREVLVAATGIADAATLLGARYHLLATNVPYLGRRDQAARLTEFADRHHNDARYDLATVFLDRLMRMLGRGGCLAIVSPQNWWQQASYRSFRRKLLKAHTIHMGCALGEEAWESFGLRGPRATLLITTADPPKPGSQAVTIDAQHVSAIEQKTQILARGNLGFTPQSTLLTDPDARITMEEVASRQLLSLVATATQGIVTGDDPRQRRCFWEIAERGSRWIFIQSTSVGDNVVGGLHGVVNWCQEGRNLARLQGLSAWGRPGVLISQMRSLAATVYLGGAFDVNTSVLVVSTPEDVPALLAFCQSDEYRKELRKIDNNVKVTTGTLTKVPYHHARWKSVAQHRFPEGLVSFTSSDPTQWIFRGLPSTSATPLQVAVARLLGYRWPDQQPDVFDAHADADGIVCIPALRGERTAADRLTDLLAAAWGQDWHPQMLTDLLAAVGHKGNLEEWLRDTFFKQHCELFHQRPFIWHIWDGHREGFSALLNYHKLDHETLKSLTWSYLGDWIRTQEVEAKAGKSGAADKLTKAKVLQQRLAAILAGEDPLDVFVRWKPIEEQPMGWHPDIDDGVRLNIRPFLTVADVGAKGAGVLRWKPSIKWGKDRGKNTSRSPWGEDRDNDLHLTLAGKRAARGET